jgi:hypothetical protein
MPYICAVFDNNMQSMITAAATRFAESSPFTFTLGEPFHIPLIGRLHTCSREEIESAIRAGFPAGASIPIEGRFLRWEVSPRARLRAVVSLSRHDGIASVSAALPCGREWRDDLFVDIGSIAGIERADWGAFIKAVSAAYPITESSVFACSHLDYVDTRGPASVVAPKQKPSTRRTAKPLGAQRVVTQSGVSKPSRRSLPHAKKQQVLVKRRRVTALMDSGMSHEVSRKSMKQRPTKPTLNPVRRQATPDSSLAAVFGNLGV